MLSQVGNSSEEKTEPEYFLTEADTAAQSVDESEGVDDQLGPGDLHYLVVDDEHVHPLGLHVGALVERLVGHCGAGRGTLAGLGGVEAGVKLEQEVEHSRPRLARQSEGAALNTYQASVSRKTMQNLSSQEKISPQIPLLLVKYP